MGSGEDNKLILQFDIYKRSDKWWKNISFSIYISFAIILFSSCLYIFKLDSSYIILLAILLLCAQIIYRSYEFEPLNGTITGKLKLYSDKICVQNNCYFFSEIKYVEINAGFYNGLNLDQFYYKNSRTKYHSGNENYIRIILNNGKEINLEFIIMLESELKKIKEYRVNYLNKTSI